MNKRQRLISATCMLPLLLFLALALSGNSTLRSATNTTNADDATGIYFMMQFR